MQGETRYQIISLLSIFAFLAIRAYYRHKTGTLQLDLSTSRDSKRLRMFVVFLSVPAVGLLIWLINPDWMHWFNLGLPEWIRWSGFALVIVGLALLSWAHQTLSASFSGNLEIRAQHKMITAGPYQWVRHPIYSAIVLWSVGVALIAANWFVGLIPVAFTLFFVLRVPLEEKMMVEAFGNEYQDYMKRTGRFMPKATAGNARQKNDS